MEPIVDLGLKRSANNGAREHVGNAHGSRKLAMDHWFCSEAKAKPFAFGFDWVRNRMQALRGSVFSAHCSVYIS